MATKNLKALALIGVLAVFASGANAATCQAAWNAVETMDSYADATCSGDLSNGDVARACSAALDLLEQRISEYEQCMALDSNGPL